MKFCLFAILMSMGAYACQSTPKGARETKRKPSSTANGTSQLTWDNHFKGYFDSSCKGCHGNDGPNQPKFETYDDVKELSSQILGSIKGDRMPPGSPAESSFKKQLEQWIGAGMPKKAQSSDRDQIDDPPVTKLTYENGIKQIVDANCVSCHGTGAQATYPNLSTFDLLKFSADRSWDFIESGAMPKAPATMSDSDKKKFKEWLDDGAPEQDDSGDQGASTDGSDNESDSAGNLVSYQQDIAPLMQRACGPCHTSGNQQPKLDSLSQTSSAASGAIRTMNSGSMPPGYSGKSVSEQDKQLFQKWIDVGKR